MKQLRITAEHFVPRGEQGHPDAGMHPDDLRRLRQLAGLTLAEDYYSAGGHDPAIDTPNDCDQNTPSPVGSNISTTGMEKRQLEKAHHIRPGSPEWFQLWFSKPYLTGEKPIGDGPAPQYKKLHNHALDGMKKKSND
jgi:hypothetical protein